MSDLGLEQWITFPRLFYGSQELERSQGDFFEEQNALDIMPGFFLVSLFMQAGEALLEFCADDDPLMHWSRILLRRERTSCLQFATSSSNNICNKLACLD